MSLITEIFGTIILVKSKTEVIDLIRSSPLILPESQTRYLRDWAAAVGVELVIDDFKEVERKLEP